MPDYRRTWHPGGTYLFSVNAFRRHGQRHIVRLRDALRAYTHN